MDRNFIPVVACSVDRDWYLIPKEIHDQFSCNLNEIEQAEEDSSEWYELVAKFNDKYNKYRTLGDLNNIQLYIEQKPE